jgi:NAD(P)-dependent dehydrogenase (short-subunit alcohol dehydrogenase family)
MGRLEGRVAIVTGAGRGIGAAVAEGLAIEGARVVVSDLGVEVDGTGRDAGPADDVVRRIRERGGVARSDQTDVTDFAAAERLVQVAVEEYGRLDVLVNVAGILRDRMIFNLGKDDWDAVLDVHLNGTFNTTRHAAAWWRANRGGEYRLINFTSGAGLYGGPSQPAYAAAKMGIVGLTLSCANSLRAYGVTANCIGPVATTRMTMGIGGGKAINQYDPSNERMSPANVVPPVVYLASTESGWINRRVLGAGNGRISLFAAPSVEREIVSSTGTWDTDTAFAEIETAFRSAIEYPNPFDRPRG